MNGLLRKQLSYFYEKAPRLPFKTAQKPVFSFIVLARAFVQKKTYGKKWAERKHAVLPCKPGALEQGMCITILFFAVGHSS